MADTILATWLPEAPRHIRNFDRYAALQHNWTFSLDLLKNLRQSLQGRLSDNTQTLAIAGSFGRLEGARTSDCDYIHIVRDSSHPSVEDDKACILEVIEKAGVTPPNKSGVFSAPRTEEDVIKSAGSPGEHMDELGKRMLLLLESRPVYGDAPFEQLLESLITKYCHHVARDPGKEFVFLLNDLIRYFRYICVNYEANFWREADKWPIRNLKLRHSRVLMYAGLLCVIGEASKHQSETKLDMLRKSLSLTPLERLGFVYDQNSDQSFFRVVGLYNVFVARMSDPAWRGKVNAVSYEARYTVPEFAELKANSDALVAELTRFVFARRSEWSDRFYEYLLF